MEPDFLNFQYVPLVDYEVARDIAQAFLKDTPHALELARLTLRETDTGFYEYYRTLRHKTREPSQEELEQALREVPAHANLKHTRLILEEREGAGVLYVHSALIAQAEKDYLGGSSRVLPQYDPVTLQRICREGIKYGDIGREHMKERNTELFAQMGLLCDFFAAYRLEVGAVLGYGVLLEAVKDPQREKKREKEKEN